MKRLSKRMKMVREKLEASKIYSSAEAVDLLKQFSKVKFDETVEVSFNLGVDPRKSDQMVRGAMVLPHGTGKSVRVAVFAQGAYAEAAESAGADKIGFEDLAEEIKAGQIDFDILIATPDAMAQIGKLGPILGPKGLMPNPKVGTVTTDVKTAVKNAKSGQVQYRSDKAGIVHCIIGKISFSSDQLVANLKALADAVKKAKPPSAKGIYMRKITLSSTMGPGLILEPSSLETAA